MNKDQKAILQTLATKLEYKFKTSDAGKALLERVKTGELLNEDAKLITSKLEFRFKSSDKAKELIEKLK